MKACIFDLDGTLTDTLESLTYSVNMTLKEMGLSPISEDECRRFVGNGARCLMQRALQASGDENAGRIEEGMRVYGRIFQENCTYHVTPYDGIDEMLKALKEQRIKLAVLSNKPHRQTLDVVARIFGEHVFEIVQGQSDDFPKKPDPSGILYLLEKMDVQKEECLYVGDSEVDVAVSLASGVKGIGVTWGFRPKEVLECAGAEVLIDAPAELLNYV